MPRPSLKDRRSEQILDAYLTCVARFGVEGATQERIASEAGVKRPLLRHYLGNRSQMIAALADYVIDGFATSTSALEQLLAPNGTPAQLIDILFDENTGNDPRLMLAYQALVTTVEDYPEMRQPLLDSLGSFLAVIETVLSRAAPDCPQAHVRATAQGISALHVNLDAISPLSPPAVWRSEMKQAALMLSATLKEAQ